MKCKHGLPLEVWSPKRGEFVSMCAVCKGPVRVPKPNWSKQVARYPTMRDRDGLLVEVRPTVDVSRSHSTLSVNASWSLTTRIGVITICGVCEGLANDFNDRRLEHTAKLVAYIRTKLCKHCNGPFEKDMQCPLRPVGLAHERRWLIRAMKVAACKECAGRAPAEYEVDMDELARMPDGRIRRQMGVMDAWKLTLQGRGLM